MKIEKLSVITLIALGLAACSSNQPVPVVKGDKNVDYSQPKTIHISETNPYPTQATAAEYIKKPANATALCYNGSYSIDTQNPCSTQGGVKQILQHYHAD